jgi:hypothetical protein
MKGGIRPQNHVIRWLCITAIAFLAITSFAGEAFAVPAFADQTGQPCSSCHVGAFGPQLTVFGRQFKLLGYTARSVDFNVPVSAMAIASYLGTSADQPATPPYSSNNNTTLDQISLFVAGGVGEHFGGFSQFTYDGVGRAYSWDNLDLRAVNSFDVGGTDLVAGLSLNNNPAIQDPWNTMPAWGFPYTDSALAPSPGAATVLNGGLAQSAVGVTAYAWWASSLYAEAGFYWTPGRGFMRAMGADNGVVLRGSAPYVRLGYEKDYENQNFQLGVTAFFPRLYPGGDRTADATDTYQDLSVDGSYQYVSPGSNNIYQINMRYIHEHQALDATYALGGSANPTDTLEEFAADASYYWHNQIGFTAGYFSNWGSSDSLLYADNRTGKPDSAGFLFQLDGTPFGSGDASPLGNHLNLRVGVQYRLFTKFNGAATNFDGAGSNGSGNDTFRIFTWVAL